MQQYLAAITTDIMPRSGKFPEYALPLVDDVLRETSAPATVLLLADGTGADSRAAFAAWFRERQHQLLVLGVGQETVAEGQLPLERRALQALASAGGGEYVELSVDDSDVRRMNRRINSHYVVLEDAALPWLDSGYPLLFPAMAVFLLWFRRGWTLTLSLLLVPTLLLTSPPPYSVPGNGSRACG
jgi:Ca-activated chloride channel family protein